MYLWDIICLHSLSIGRVGYESRVRRHNLSGFATSSSQGRYILLTIFDFKNNRIVSESSAFGIRFRFRDNFRIEIWSDDSMGFIYLFRFRFCFHFFEECRFVTFSWLESESTEESGSNIFGYQGCFDTDRATSAAYIIEWSMKTSSCIEYKSCCYSFFEWCFSCLGTISSTMQRLSTCIE